MDGFMTTISNDNEDWIKGRTWDLYRLSRKITTVDDLLWALSASDLSLDQQKLAITRFTKLPAWKPAPAELVSEVADFLGDSVSARRVLSAMHPAPTVGHRLPTAVELSSETDFEKMQQTWQNEIDSLTPQWDEIRDQQIEELKIQIQGSVDAGNTKTLAGILAKTTGETTLYESMTKVMEDAIVAAKAETAKQGIALPTLDTTVVTRQLQAAASGIADVMTRSLSNTAATQALTRYGVEALTGAEVAKAVEDHLKSLTPTYTKTMLGGALTQAQNKGRVFVYRKAQALSSHVRYTSSELLDKNTCDNCEDVDGTDYDSLDDAEADYSTGGYNECLGGPNCRGTIIAIFAEAETPQTG
jgi:hypothetical protein